MESSHIVPIHTFPTHKTFGVSFSDYIIQTIVTHNAAAVSLWIREEAELIHRRNPNLNIIVGLDIKWRLSNAESNPAAILQLCVGRSCLIYQLQYANDFPDSLNEFLGNKSYTFAGVDVYAKLAKLVTDYRFQFTLNAVDLRAMAAAAYQRSDLENAKLEDLARIVLEKEMDKPELGSISSWDSPRLTDDQVKHASVDAFVCFEIGRVLINSPNNSRF